MQVSLLFLLLYVLVAKTLQNYVRLLRLVQTYHIDFFSCSQLDSFRQQDFTDFALKFRKVVSSGHTNDLLLDFTKHPVFETSHMDELATPLTTAWVYQRILLSTFFTKTNFACACHVLFNFIRVSIEF